MSPLRQLKLCPLDIESLDTGIHGWYVDLPIFDTPVFLNNSGIFEKEVGWAQPCFIIACQHIYAYTVYIPAYT